MYYDRNKNYWDDRTCAFENSDRCVKMDCHLPNTHFSLLGFFKEPGYGDWFEQLFKHEGDCVWTDEEYRFMQSFREVWPERCTEAGTFPNTNSSLFYDIKPSMYGEMEIGLYTDTNCIQEYQGSYTAEKAMRELVCSGQVEAGDEEGIDIADLCAIGQANMITALTVYKKGSNYTSDEEEHHDERGDLWGLVSQVEKWNRAFDVYKQCQPCKTYDLTNIVAGKNYQKSYDHIRYNWTSAAMWDRDNGEGDEGEEFRCHDAAGYDNVNQVRDHPQIVTIVLVLRFLSFNSPRTASFVSSA